MDTAAPTQLPGEKEEVEGEVVEEGEKEIGAKMQELALAEGALPQHLLTALFTQSADGRQR